MSSSREFWFELAQALIGSGLLLPEDAAAMVEGVLARHEDTCTEITAAVEANLFLAWMWDQAMLVRTGRRAE
jgi:hypothetical protein